MYWKTNNISLNFDGFFQMIECSLTTAVCLFLSGNLVLTCLIVPVRWIADVSFHRCCKVEFGWVLLKSLVTVSVMKSVLCYSSNVLAMISFTFKFASLPDYLCNLRQGIQHIVATLQKYPSFILFCFLKST